MMPPGIRNLDRAVETLFWRRLARIVLLILTVAVVLVGLLIWRLL